MENKKTETDVSEISKISERIKNKFSFDNLKGGFFFFSTKKQKTWLVFSDNEMFCVLQEFEGDKLSFKFRMRIKDLKENIEKIKFKKYDPSFLGVWTEQAIIKSEKFGIISFPNVDEDMYYSKDLFPFTNEIIDNINEYIK